MITHSALTAHFLVGEIALTLICFLTAGTIIGSLPGPKVVKNVKIDRLYGPIRIWYTAGPIIFGIFMVLSAFNIISKHL